MTFHYIMKIFGLVGVFVHGGSSGRFEKRPLDFLCKNAHLTNAHLTRNLFFIIIVSYFCRLKFYFISGIVYRP